MSSRKRNMLEAFQASAREAAEEPEASAAAGGPFAEEEQTPQEPETPLPPTLDEMPRVGLNEVLGTAPLTKLFGALLILLGVAFWLGYVAGTAPVEAAAPNGDRVTGRPEESSTNTPPRNDGSGLTNDPSSPGTSAGMGGTSSGGTKKTPYDLAFFSIENTATLRVASYDKNSRNTKLAWETYDYLFSEGLPVVTPVSKTKSIFIFVGATPSVEDLAEVKERVQALDGPSGGRPFADAYAVNIEDYVKR